VRDIHFVRNGGEIVCRLDGYGLPSSWRYGELIDGAEVTCAPLLPGRYGIAVFGDARGEAEFILAKDGTLTVTDILCSRHRAKQKASGE
jgi:hypothetical protein